MTPFPHDDDIRIVELPEDEEPVVAPEPPALHYPQIRKEFLLAGHAYFVVVNPKGARITYCVRARTGKPGSKFYDPGKLTYFLRAWNLHTNTYEYVGIIEPTTGEIVPTGRSRFTKGTPELDVAQWAVSSVFECRVLADGFEITHHNRCGKCGRALADAGARQTGFHVDCLPPAPEDLDDVEDGQVAFDAMDIHDVTRYATAAELAHQRFDAMWGHGKLKP